MPAAMATTFLSAPPSSQPTTSGFVKIRKVEVVNSGCSAAATYSSDIASTDAAGSPAITSLARFGPVSTPMGRPATTSSATSVMRIIVSRSSPLVRLTTGTHGRRWAEASSSVERNAEDGTPTTRTSAAATAEARSDVASRDGWRS